MNLDKIAGRGRPSRAHRLEESRVWGVPDRVRLESSPHPSLSVLSLCLCLPPSFPVCGSGAVFLPLSTASPHVTQVVFKVTALLLPLPPELRGYPQVPHTQLFFLSFLSLVVSVPNGSTVRTSCSSCNENKQEGPGQQTGLAVIWAGKFII